MSASPPPADNGPVAADENTSPSSQPTSIAFIVHSANTLTNNLPPNIDNRPLARQKRRRTSPEDQLILEAEYAKNSKPDKAARMAIVSRVALGEKEVQIWFQNRRQASRRRSKPLEMHEIVEYQRMRASQHASPSIPPPPQDLFTKTPTRNAQSTHITPDSGVYLNRSLPPPTTSTATPSVTVDSYKTPGYLADLRNETPRSSHDGQDMTPSVETVSKPPRDALRRTSSNVRLSMCFDGNAKIITKDDSSPSPTRQLPTPHALLHPSLSSENTDPTADTENADTKSTAAARKPSGRSRDSRAWEYWAEKGARSELEEKAVQETTGSAAGAIGLIRSASGRSVLGPLTNKRASLVSDNQQSAKRARREPLLQRSHSMHNRLPPGWAKTDDDKPRRMKKAQSGLGIEVFSGESDKENRSPGHRATVTPGKTLLAARRLSSSDDEDEEVEAFMAEGRVRKGTSNSVSEEEELDCVQGLLSLSQGNWR